MNDKNVRGASVRTTYGKSTKTVVLNRPSQLHIVQELSTSENDQNHPLQSIIEKICDITPDGEQKIETFSCKKREYFEQINV